VPLWKLVHIVVRWAMVVVAQQEGQGRIRLPELSQLQLGRLMSRSDPFTCMDIAMDIVKHDPTRTQFTEEQMADTIRAIRDGFGETTSAAKSRGYSRNFDSIVVARRLLDAVDRQIRSEHHRRGFDAVVHTTTFSEAARLCPGRDWASLRDDFRAQAMLLWTAESIDMAAAIDQMARVLEEQRTARRKRS